ncbi:MAG TPA: YCF48-related protein [Anditalea sp.]|nr:YCF48-related protein [Anditalea sp.]
MSIKSFTLFLITSILLSCENRKQEEYTTPQGWDFTESPIRESVRGLSPLTEEIAWATGSGGTWMVTLDGGLTWTHGIIDGLDTVDFRDIEAINAATAIAISSGQPAVIYKTTDAGTTWKRVYQGSEEDFFNGMVFVDDRLGFAYGDPVDGKWVILRTSDGGEIWEPLYNPPVAAEGEAGFAASGSTMVMEEDAIWLASGGSQSKVYYTPNRGGRWEVVETPIQQGASSQGIFSLSIIDNSNLIAVGGDFESPDDFSNNIVLSHDDGKTWVSNNGIKPSGYRSGVTYFPRFHWVITVGPNGSDYSSDGGENWERFSDEGFHAVKLSKSGGSVWAAGSGGRVARLNFVKK